MAFIGFALQGMQGIPTAEDSDADILEPAGCGVNDAASVGRTIGSMSRTIW
jgi:hypothetical protein